ncbi:SGNH/GDSL hydrolase family protein [Allorhizobium undicola]|uniref:SGNH/GDSL hydrolase family protein n=1 Tax=Allorhizobium undicola TaxID=78527 RepID=UPI0004868F26|nr:SGNH/GDSL hydrolase family protein [Allorhizobium undicola]
MPVLLIYGDSNTYGASPTLADGSNYRYGPDIRWPARLEKALGAGWRVIDEGLPGRTTVHDNPITGAHKNGLAVLPAILESHAPIDIVAVMLGTNDLKARLNLPAADIAEGLRQILRRIRQGGYGPDAGQPRLLVLAPVPIDEVPPHDETMAGGAAKSRRLASLYKQVAVSLDAAFFDAGLVAEVSPVDGVHLTEEGHIALANALVPVIRSILA